MRPLVKVALLALGPALGLGIARFAYGLLLPPMKQELGWSYADAGWMNTFNAVGYVIGALTTASLSMRLGASSIYRAGSIVTVMSVLALGLTENFILLSIFRTISGISGGWIFVSGGTIAATLANENQAARGAMIGLFYAGAGFGIAFTGLVIPQWIDRFGTESWPAAWLLLGAIGMVFGIATWRAAGPSKPDNRQGRKRMPYSPRHHRWILCAYAAFGAGSIGYMTFMVTYLQEASQPSWHISAFWMTMGLSAMTAPWLWADVIGRWPHARGFALLVGINAIGAIIPLVSTAFPAVLLSAAIFGCVFFAVVAATTDFVMRNVAATQRTEAIGIFTVVFGLGQIFGPLAIGVITDAHGSLRIGLATGSMLILSGCILALLQRDDQGISLRP